MTDRKKAIELLVYARKQFCRLGYVNDCIEKIVLSNYHYVSSITKDDGVCSSWLIEFCNIIFENVKRRREKC